MLLTFQNCTTPLWRSRDKGDNSIMDCSEISLLLDLTNHIYVKLELFPSCFNTNLPCPTKQKPKCTHDTHSVLIFWPSASLSCFDHRSKQLISSICKKVLLLTF